MLALSKELQNTFKLEDEITKAVNNGDSSKNINICIINDSPIVQEGIVSALQNVSGVDKITTISKNDFLDNKSTEQNNIVITEIEFSDKIDIHFVQEIKSISPDAKVIVYTRFLNHAIRTRLLNDGADAFIFLRDISYLLGHIVKMIIRTIPNLNEVNNSEINSVGN